MLRTGHAEQHIAVLSDVFLCLKLCADEMMAHVLHVAYASKRHLLVHVVAKPFTSHRIAEDRWNDGAEKQTSIDHGLKREVLAKGERPAPVAAYLAHSGSLICYGAVGRPLVQLREVVGYIRILSPEARTSCGERPVVLAIVVQSCPVAEEMFVLKRHLWRALCPKLVAVVHEVPAQPHLQVEVIQIEVDGNEVTLELIVEGNGAESNRAAYIFSLLDGHACYAGKIHTGHTSFCSDPGENGILLYHAHMGSMSINRIKLIDGRLESEVVVPTTSGFQSSLDYPPAASFIPGAANLNYCCKVDNPILFSASTSITEWLEHSAGDSTLSTVWPENNAEYYTEIIDGNQNVLLRGTINRENYIPYLPFSSVLSYERKTYSGANPIEKYMLCVQNYLYSDLNGDGTTDCLLLLADLEGRMRIPLILSYDDGVCFAYIQEDLASELLDIKLSENGSLEYKMKSYIEDQALWKTVKLFFSKDSFLFIRGN